MDRVRHAARYSTASNDVHRVESTELSLGRIMQGRIEDVTAVGQAAPAVREQTEQIGRSRSVREAYRRLYRWIAVTDALSIAFALLLAYWIRFDSGSRSRHLRAAAGLAARDAGRLRRVPPLRRLPVPAGRGVPPDHPRGLARRGRASSSFSFWSKAELLAHVARAVVGVRTVAALASRRLWHSKITRPRPGASSRSPRLIVGTNAEAPAPGRPDAAPIVRVPRPSAWSRPRHATRTRTGPARSRDRRPTSAR